MKKIVTTNQVGPFTIVTVEEQDVKKHLIACGKKRLPDEYDTYEEAEQKVKEHDYEVIGLFVETYVDYLKTEK